MPLLMRIVIDDAQLICNPTNIGSEVCGSARLRGSVVLRYNDKDLVRASLASLVQSTRYIEKRLIVGT